MCKFYSGFGGVRGADSRINSRPVGLEIAPRIRNDNLVCREAEHRQIYCSVCCK